MKLKSVEGQLKVVQEKLRYNEETYSESLEEEKKQWETELISIKEQHQKELIHLKEQIAVLTSQLIKKTQVSLPSPESPGKKMKNREGRRQTELPSNLATRLNLPGENRLSKSVDNLANWNDNDDGPRVALSKMTITELVEESLQKPEGIAMIRKELKAAKLTPKIQRKFGPDTKPPPLKMIESPGSDHAFASSPSPLETHLQVHQANLL